MELFDKLQLDEVLANTEELSYMAKLVKTIYDAFIAEGFESAEAMFLTTSILGISLLK